MIRSWFNRKLRLFTGALGAGLLPLLAASPSWSADRIYASFGPVERYIPVDQLETYAQTGKLTGELEVYARYFNPEQLQQFRSGLQASAPVDVVTIAQFLYTPQGEALLEWLGEVVQTAGRQNGSRAIRGALILAAADPDGGLTAINVLKHFPTQGPRVDLQRLLVIAQAGLSEIDQTLTTTEQLFNQSIAALVEADNDAPFASGISLTTPGPYRWGIQSFDIPIPTNLYLPEGRNFSLVVLSHGLGGDRSTLAYVAEHLASHGFAVAIVEHPGSSSAQLEALFTGRASNALDPRDMISRPVAIQDLLDELATKSRQEPALRGRFDTRRVGVLGQSMGAYTTLALAGATVDLNRLDRICPPQIIQLNLSLLLQCLVPSLPEPLPTLRDDRVKAGFAINPLTSAVFGPRGMSQIDVPVMIAAGSNDTVTPALAEQIRPFTWLDSPERHLLLMEGGTHFSTIYDPTAAEAVPVPELAIGPSPEIAQRYTKALSLAFFKTYLDSDETYSQFLSPAYAAAISRDDLPIALLQELDLDD